MDNTVQNDRNNASSSQIEQQKIAVPYVSPPSKSMPSPRKFQSPIVNGIIVAFVILLGGFMAYNFVGHSLTQTAGISNVQVSPVVSPTATPTPTP